MFYFIKCDKNLCYQRWITSFKALLLPLNKNNHVEALSFHLLSGTTLFVSRASKKRKPSRKGHKVLVDCLFKTSLYSNSSKMWNWASYFSLKSAWEETGKWRDNWTVSRRPTWVGAGERDARGGLHLLRPSQALHHRHPLRHRLLHLLWYQMQPGCGRCQHGEQPQSP